MSIFFVFSVGVGGGGKNGRGGGIFWLMCARSLGLEAAKKVGVALGTAGGKIM